MLRQLFILLLIVACRPVTALADTEYWEYTFRPGDSIWKIAEKYTTSVDNWYEIRELNRIGEGPDRRIRPGATIIIPVAMLKQQPTPAMVIAVSGDATVVRANGDQQVLEVGSEVHSGDKLVTADQQRVRVQFADKSELQVQSNTTIVFDKISHHKDTGMVDTRIRLNSGSVRSWVEKLKPESHYEIRTPAAVTAVRGTAFRLASTGTISRTEVTEGNVGVGAGGVERSVDSGYGIVAEKDKPLPEPVKLLPPPVLSENQSSDSSILQVSWQQLDGAETYRYQLASDEDFNQVVTEGSTTDSTIALEGLAPGRYYLLVRAVDRFQLEGLDATRDYDVRQAPVKRGADWLIPVSVGVMILIL